MKRWLIALLAVLCLAVPSSASAVTSSLTGHMFTVRGSDLNAMTSAEQSIAIADRFTVRASFVANAVCGRGNYNAKIDALFSQDVPIWPLLVWRGPGVCDGGLPEQKLNTGNPTDMANFKQGVANVLADLNDRAAALGKPQPNLVEILNEPNCDFQYPRYTVADYNLVHAKAGEGVRLVDPDAAFIHGGLGWNASSCTNPDNWIPAWQAAGNYTAAFAVHPYGTTNDSYAQIGQVDDPSVAANWASRQAARACNLANLYGKGMFITETGRSSEGSSKFTEGEQATFLDDFASQANAYFNAIGNSSGQDADNTTTYSKGLLREDNSQKPAYTHWRFGGIKFPRVNVDPGQWCSLTYVNNVLF